MSQPISDTRTLYYQQGKTWFKLTIPSTAKVTFGPLIPGRGDNMGIRNQGMYLRVYKTKDHQLAVVPNVIQFRDADAIFEAPTTEGYTVIDERALLGEMVEAELKKTEIPECPFCGGELEELYRNRNNIAHVICTACERETDIRT